MIDWNLVSTIVMALSIYTFGMCFGMWLYEKVFKKEG